MKKKCFKVVKEITKMILTGQQPQEGGNKYVPKTKARTKYAVFKFIPMKIGI